MYECSYKQVYFYFYLKTTTISIGFIKKNRLISLKKHIFD